MFCCLTITILYPDSPILVTSLSLYIYNEPRCKGRPVSQCHAAPVWRKMTSSHLLSPMSAVSPLCWPRSSGRPRIWVSTRTPLGSPRMAQVFTLQTIHIKLSCPDNYAISQKGWNFYNEINQIFDQILTSGSQLSERVSGAPLGPGVDYPILGVSAFSLSSFSCEDRVHGVDGVHYTDPGLGCQVTTKWYRLKSYFIPWKVFHVCNKLTRTTTRISKQSDKARLWMVVEVIC